NATVHVTEAFQMETNMRRFSLSLIAAAIVLTGCRADGASPGATPSPSPKAISPATNESAPVENSGVTESRPADAAARSATHDVTLRAGTVLPVVLEHAVGSDISRVEQPVHAHLSRAIRSGGVTVLPPGSRVNG